MVQGRSGGWKPVPAAARHGTDTENWSSELPISKASIAEPLNPDHQHEFIWRIDQECNESFMMRAEV